LPVDAADKSVKWSSSNLAVASVDANGKVTALNEGVAIITVTTNDGGHTASCIVTVTKKVTPIEPPITPPGDDDGTGNPLAPGVGDSKAVYAWGWSLVLSALAMLCLLAFGRRKEN